MRRNCSVNSKRKIIKESTKGIQIDFRVDTCKKNNTKQNQIASHRHKSFDKFCPCAKIIP